MQTVFSHIVQKRLSQENENVGFRTRLIYPDNIKEKAQQRILTLEDLLSLGTRDWITFAAFGYDEFSGARKLFTSKSYEFDDVKSGSFQIRGLNVVETETTADNDNTNETAV